MKRKLKYQALREAAEKHRRLGEEHRILALRLDDEANELKHRSITGRFWRDDETE